MGGAYADTLGRMQKPLRFLQDLADMGTRVIRDGLLESEAVLSLPPEGRWLFVSIILSADDYGLFEATPFKLAKRGDVKREHIAHLVGLLVDADLVRLYHPDPSSPRVFGFVPKFGARMRGYRARYPIPPAALVADQGADFLREFNHLAERKSDHRPPVADFSAPPSDRRRLDADADADADKEKEFLSPSGLETLVVEPAVSTTVAPCPTDQIVELWHDCCAPPLPTVGVLNAARRSAIAARWREVCAASSFDRERGLEWFGWLFRERVASSAFLMGRGDSGFRCSLDWLMRPSNFAKTCDGNYADRKGKR